MRLALALLLLLFACKPPQVQTSARDESRDGSGAGRPNGPLTAGGGLQGAATGTNVTAPINAAWPSPPSGWVAAESSLVAGYVSQKGTTGIPEYIRLYRFHSAQTKDSMYLAIAKLAQANITVGYTGKAAVTSQLARSCVFGVNGGYFSGKQSVSIVKIGDDLKSTDAQNLVRPSGTAQPTRATFFWDEASRRAFFHWASVMQGKIQIFATAADPYTAGRRGGSSPAVHSLALGAGPMLIWQDAVTVTTAKEAFDAGIHEDQPQPRTAIGVTQGGYLVALVVDGRSDQARGLTLEDLARALKSWGATSAMNFDGGGSSTFVVAGKVWNRPSDGGERAVWSALCVN